METRITAHDARLADNGATLALTPVGGRGDQTSLEAFQSIAQQVFEAESYNEITIVLKHKNNQVPGDLWDSLIISRA